MKKGLMFGLFGLLFIFIGIYTFQNEFSSELPAPSINDYMIVDLSSGEIEYQDSAPSDLLTNLNYKTTKLVLRRIPAGTFTMGSPANEPGRRCRDDTSGNCANGDSNEAQHGVTLTKDFYIGVFKITQGQYQKIMGLNPASPSFRGDSKPVINVKWSSARGGTWPQSSWPGTPYKYSFTGRLSSKTGIKFDLPTDATWEYSCRAGTITGLNNGKELAYVDENNDGASSGGDPNAIDVCVGGYGVITNVGSKNPNNWGLYDFHCNGAEWVLDWGSPARLPTYYNSVTDPLGPTQSEARSWDWEYSRTTKLTRNDLTMGMGGARCADSLIDIFGEAWANPSYEYYNSIIGPGFRVAAEAPVFPDCTNSDWTSSISPEICPSSEKQIKIWTKTNSNCQGGVQHPASEEISCYYDDPTADGVYCDDGDSCTVGDAYNNGICKGEPKPCSDGISCTNDYCLKGSCVYDTGSCQCLNSTDCDDGNVCTEDNCYNNKCIITYQTVGCNDGNENTINDVCTKGICSGTEILIEDEETESEESDQVNQSEEEPIEDLQTFFDEQEQKALEESRNKSLLETGGSLIVVLSIILVVILFYLVWNYITTGKFLPKIKFKK